MELSTNSIVPSAKEDEEPTPSGPPFLLRRSLLPSPAAALPLHPIPPRVADDNDGVDRGRYATVARDAAFALAGREELEALGTELLRSCWLARLTRCPAEKVGGRQVGEGVCYADEERQVEVEPRRGRERREFDPRFRSSGGLGEWSQWTPWPTAHRLATWQVEPRLTVQEETIFLRLGKGLHIFRQLGCRLNRCLYSYEKYSLPIKMQNVLTFFLPPVPRHILV